MRIQRVLWLILVVSLSRGALALFQQVDSSELLKTADEMVQNVARLRGLEPKAPILKGVKTREEISKFLNQRAYEDYDEGEIQQEGDMLRKLGLIPAAIDYKELSIKLLTEQIQGYYDPKKKTLFIASWLPAEEQKPVMVHELTHALQDQYFDINNIVGEDRKRHNDDRTLAHQAIFEGDGMAVMLNYLLEPAKRNFASLPNLAFIMQAQMTTAQSQFAVFKSAPLYLQETLMFPYGYGAAFLQKAWTKNPSWEAVNKVYSDLPASTEQIIHPEKYLADRDNPKPVSAGALAAKLGDNWKAVYRNVLGEFSISLLLTLHLSEERAKRSATGWGGDEVLLMENRAGKKAVLVETSWDTSDDAEKFYAAMQEWLQRSFPKAHRTDEPPSGFSLIQDGEFHWIRREGAGVSFIVGLPEAEGQKFSAPSEKNKSDSEEHGVALPHPK